MFKTIAVVTLSIAGTMATAAPITYNINQVIGLGSVTGTIQTNGTTGVLGQSDVLGFDLFIGGPGAAIELTQADSVVVTQGGNLSASGHNLFFDYSGPSGFLLFQFGSFGTGMRYYCNASVAGTCFQGASAIPDSFNSPSAQVEPRTGNQIIGSVVPEPVTWALMLSGFIMVGAVMRRRTAPVTVGA